MAFRRLLQLSCDVLECVSNGPAAIEAAVRHQPDVIVVDLMMPDMDGLEVCRRVKQASPGTDVVIVTAFDDKHMHDVALQEGASAFVAKQSGEALEDAIRRIFDSRLDERIGIK